MNIPNKPREVSAEELKISKELGKFKDCHIFVNTNFKRQSEPIFVLALLESKRKINIEAKELAYKPLDEILVMVSNIIKSHYKETQGNIGIWGNIVNYVYHHTNAETYSFNTNGEDIKGSVIYKSRAILSLR